MTTEEVSGVPTMLQKLERFLSLVKQAKAIFDSGLSWEVKYDLIFSKEIRHAIYHTEIEPDYYDPDTTYQADVTAYMEAITARAIEIESTVEELRKIA